MQCSNFQTSPLIPRSRLHKKVTVRLVLMFSSPHPEPDSFSPNPQTLLIFFYPHLGLPSCTFTSVFKIYCSELIYTHTHTYLIFLTLNESKITNYEACHYAYTFICHIANQYFSYCEYAEYDLPVDIVQITVVWRRAAGQDRLHRCSI
jgi:hypothetical protein